jgi:hypothetical protein
MESKDTNIMVIEQQITSMQKDIEFIKDAVKELKQYIVDVQRKNEDKEIRNEEKYVTKDQLHKELEKFKPVKLITYGMVAIILTAFLTSIIAGILKS